LEPVFAACSAAALYRREMINDTGFLDSDFFLYDEDVDLSFRAQRADWKCMYVSDAVVKDNATAGRLSDTHVYDHARNLEFVWIKNMPTGLILRFAHPQDYSGMGSFCYLCLCHLKSEPFLEQKGMLRMLPVMLKKRKQMQEQRQVSNKYMPGADVSIFAGND